MRVQLAAACGLIGSSVAVGATVSAVKALPDNSAAALDDVTVISTFDLINSAANKAFQVRDATGALTVFGTNAIIDDVLNGVDNIDPSDDIVAGDRISMLGTTDIFNG